MTITATPTRKLAHLVQRGEHIRYERRVYRVGHNGLALAIPRDGRPSRSVCSMTLWDSRGNSRKVTFEQSDLLTLVVR